MYVTATEGCSSVCDAVHGLCMLVEVLNVFGCDLVKSL